MAEVKISICIPTYNGEKTLPATLDSIISQMESEVELVLCDDASTDSTFAIIQKYAAKYSFIRVHKNEKNLGMDLNFQKVAMLATTDFVWFSGQDDIFDPGVIAKVVSVLKSEKNLGFIYINFAQYNHDMTEMLCSSMQHLQAVSPETFSTAKDLLLHTKEEYFSVLKNAPSFLPATIMRKEYWHNVDVKPYLRTHFIQLAVILLNLGKHDFYLVTKPMIKGRVPNDRWQVDGQDYFTIMMGCVKAETLVFKDARNPIPPAIFLERKKKFFRDFFALVRRSKRTGMKVNMYLLRSLYIIFGFTPAYFFVILPIMFSPLFFMDLVHSIYIRVKS